MKLPEKKKMWSLRICPVPDWVSSEPRQILSTMLQEKIAELAALQQEILHVVCGYVKPDGTLLYSTCTMTREENEDNVQKFLETHAGFELEQMRQYFPYEGCDGFFMAKMHRR